MTNSGTPRRRRLLRAAAGGLGAGVVFLLIAAVVLWGRGGLPVTAAVTHITEPLGPDGLVDYAAAMAPPPLPPSENGAVDYFAVAINDWASFGPQASPAARSLGVPPKPDGVSGVEWWGDVVGTSEVWGLAEAGGLLDVGGRWTEPTRRSLESQERSRFERPWTAGELPVAAEWLAANARPLARVRAGASKPGYRFWFAQSGPLSERLLPLQTHRTGLGRLLLAATLRSVGDGAWASAASDADALRRLARQNHPDSFPVEMSAAGRLDRWWFEAETAVLRAAPTAADVDARRKAWRTDGPLRGFARAVDRGGRFLALDDLQQIYRAGRGGKMGARARAALWIPGGLKARCALRMLNVERYCRRVNVLYDRAVAVLNGPADERVAKAAAADFAALQELNSLRPSALWRAASGLPGDWDSVLKPNTRGAAVAMAAAEARIALLEVAAAGRLFELKAGRPPRSVDDLVPAFLAEWPADPADGGPLKTEAAEDGAWAVSSGLMKTTPSAGRSVRSLGVRFGP